MSRRRCVTVQGSTPEPFLGRTLTVPQLPVTMDVMFDWRRFFVQYGICSGGGSVVGLIVWVVWGDRPDMGLIGIVTVPIVALLLMGIGLGSGGVISQESANDVYSVQHSNRVRRFAGDSGARRTLSLAAVAAAFTIGLIATALFVVFVVE